MTRRAIRIANFSGYIRDRNTAIAEAVNGDPVDVLIGDYLAEVTLAALSGELAENPGPRYVAKFLRQLAPELGAIAERGLKVVTNAGGFDPAGLAQAVRDLVAEQGLTLQVAHIEGDNLLPDLDRLQEEGHEFTHLDSGKPLRTWQTEPYAANAYLGGWGITEALRRGVDIVITGRVTDASLTSGPAAWWHDWPQDAWDALAGAITAGHVIECGAHATGGNFSGFDELSALTRPGFPIAEIAADGSSVITKHRGDDGAVTVDTVTAQLVYEIQGPRYLNPDVTVHLESVRLTQLEADRVAIAPVVGSPPTPTAKVALFAPIGYQVCHYAYLTSPRAEAKLALLREQLTAQLGDVVETLDITALGRPADDPASQWEATVAVRVMATARDAKALRIVGPALAGLYLSSYPGFHQDGATPVAYPPMLRTDYWPALLDTTVVEHRLCTADGETVAIGGAPQTQPVTPVPSEPGQPRSAEGSARPLATVAYARSGDKGGNANVGVWVPDPAAWEWLAGTLTAERFAQWFPELAVGGVVRHEFPHLRAVHFVALGVLGTGGSSNLRVDQLGKSMGEYVLSRHVPIPDELLRGRDVVV
ncbi:acyclic terpene utilization AtuA family protein [Nocardia harenae]|uniref:acyclic terpene utilization AtuA family protein n=1 Tax=Nocardia harenae TaxID=358707 RepID=UPI00082DF705|nr:acyclic terpene utilization AtuA family protein [Nocardia harenae]